MKTVWVGDKPEQCDICHAKIEDAFVDGKIPKGPWGITCPFCALMYGVRLGEGHGQLYQRDNDFFVKIRG